MSPWKRYKLRWGNCTSCGLSKSRTNIVLARGTVPAPLCFVGEAPGASEDVLGQPFIGPAGHLLQRMINLTVPSTIKYALTNLVACMPPKDEKGKQEPPRECILACRARLGRFLVMCRPTILVAVGGLSKKWLEWDWLVSLFGEGLDFLFVRDIVHPAAILRMEEPQRSMAIQRTIVTLEDAVSDLER